MADDPPSSGNVNPDDHRYQSEAKVEDADTRAAREELRHSHISDNGNSGPQAPGSGPSSTDNQNEQGEDDEMKLRSGREYDIPAPVSARRNETPDLAPPENLSRDDNGERKVSSPKKKRAHDEVEAHRDSEGHASNGTDSDGWVMVDEGGANKGRSEPQKKRARDETSPPADIHQAPATVSQRAALGFMARMRVNLLPPDYFRYLQARILGQGQPTTTDLPLQIRRFGLREAGHVLCLAFRRGWSHKECVRRWSHGRSITLRKLRRTTNHGSLDVDAAQPTKAQLRDQGRFGTIAICCHERRQTGNRRLRKWLWWWQPVLECARWGRDKDRQFRLARATAYH